MKWTFSIRNKLAASAILFSLCMLVLLSNYIDRHHTDKVKNAISTLYEDRLLAEEYILTMTSGICQVKEQICINGSNTQQQSGIDNALLHIYNAYNAYQKTKLTSAEKQKSDQLHAVLQKLAQHRSSSTDTKLALGNSALLLLNELSSIQLQESRAIIHSAEDLYASGKISSQFVFVLIILLLIVIQALVFASKPLMPKGQSHHNN